MFSNCLPLTVFSRMGCCLLTFLNNDAVISKNSCLPKNHKKSDGPLLNAFDNKGWFLETVSFFILNYLYWFFIAKKVHVLELCFIYMI